MPMFASLQFGVVSLFNLLVREKRDARDTKGIYLISQTKQNPEMYEIVFNSTVEIQKWAEILRNAVEKCPVEGIMAVHLCSGRRGNGLVLPILPFFLVIFRHILIIYGGLIANCSKHLLRIVCLTLWKHCPNHPVDQGNKC